MKKIILSIIIALTFAHPLALAQTDPAPFFGSNPLAAAEDKGRDLLTCLSGYNQFLSAGIGYEGALDYIADFFLWPSHYADVAALQAQVNKARYAVIAAYFRCDLDRLKSVTNAYYTLEAELYFVRHFVDTSGGYARILPENSGTREELKKKFLEDMDSFFKLRDEGDSEKAYRAVLEGYFDLFVAKYKDHGARYASVKGDPIFDQLDEKFQKLADTFKSFSELGKQFVGVGKEVKAIGVDAANAVDKAATSLSQSPGKAMLEAGESIDNMFKVCPGSGNPDDCKSLSGALMSAGGVGVDIVKTAGGVLYEIGSTAVGTVIGAGEAVGGAAEESFSTIADLLSSSPQTKITLGEVNSLLDKIELIKSEGDFQGTLRARYELLYGRVGGEGLRDAIATLDRTIATLRDNSTKTLDSVQHCAAYVVGKVCK